MATPSLLLGTPDLVVASWLGWQGLSPYEQVCVVAGIALMGWAMTSVYALFGGLTLRRTKPKLVSSGARKSTVRPKAKRKAKRKRRR